MASSNPTDEAKDVVADSWDDEEIPSDREEDSQDNSLQPTGTTTSASSWPTMPGTPPPTPTVPSTSNQGSGPGQSYASRREPLPERRPEKTDAVARRMIAAGLGLKTPKLTGEQREYQKSVREQERKRREAARQEEARKKEEAEKAKAAIWDD
jgi:hypothetical protein